MSEAYGPSRPEGTPPPDQQVGTPPPRAHPGVEQARLAAQLLGPAIVDLREEIREARKNHRTEFIILISAFAAGFLVLAGMAIEAYRWSHDDMIAEIARINTRLDRVEQQQSASQDTLVRADTKLEDLLARIPPIQTPLRK